MSMSGVIAFTRNWVQIGQLQIRYYGISYALLYFICLRRITARLAPVMTADEVSRLAEVVFISGIVGGRLWYLVIRYIEDGTPILYHAFYLWEGGMAFQGGLFLGFCSGILYVHIIKKATHLGTISDSIFENIPLGICIGRIGNFLNDEFMNKVTFLQIPSCIFAALTEGLIPWAILTAIKDRRPFYKSAFSCVLYGIMRFINDIFREEESYKIGFLELKISQYICIIIICLSLLTLWRLSARAAHKSCSQP